MISARSDVTSRGNGRNEGTNDEMERRHEVERGNAKGEKESGTFVEREKVKTR